MITIEFCCGISSQRNLSQLQLLFLAISLLSQWLIEINKIGLIFICSSNVILKSMILPYQHDESETKWGKHGRHGRCIDGADNYQGR